MGGDGDERGPRPQQDADDDFDVARCGNDVHSPATDACDPARSGIERAHAAGGQRKRQDVGAKRFFDGSTSLRLMPNGKWKMSGYAPAVEYGDTMAVLDNDAEFGGNGTAHDAFGFLRKPVQDRVARRLEMLLRRQDAALLSALHWVDELASTIECPPGWDDLWEVACSPKSRLSQKHAIYKVGGPFRVTLEDGHDLEKSETIRQLLLRSKTSAPKRMWISIPCTVWSGQRNANQETPQQVKRLEKRRVRARRLAHNVVDLVEGILEINPNVQVYWEWSRASQGWNIAAAQRLRTLFKTRNKPWERASIDGC